jgi:hypothetical protein
MASKSQHSIMFAAIAVGLAAMAGIAAIEGWLTLPGAAPEPPAQSPAARPRIAATPAESLLPGETIVEGPAASPPASPAPSTPRARPACPNCGEVSSTAYRQFDRGGAWEVRVRFDDGTRGTLRYPTDPGFRVGERVVMSNGRLKRY